MYPFLWVFSDCIWDQNCLPNTIVFAKTSFQKNVPVGIPDFLYVRPTRKLHLVEILVLVTCAWSSDFVFSKNLDYTQYYMMLLEQYEHLVAKVQATVTWLDENQFMFARSRYWTILLPWRKTLSTFPFQICRLLMQYVLHCTRIWDCRYKCF